MSYYPKKGMHLTKEKVAVFDRPGLPQNDLTKRWWKGEVIRKATNSKGEVVRKNKQEAEVFAREDQVAGMLCRRCPDPGMGDGDVQMNVYYEPLG